MASNATSFEEEEGDRSPPGKVVKEIDLEGLDGILEELTPKSNGTTTPNGTSRSSHSPRKKSMKSYDAATGAFSPSRTSTGEIADVMVFQSTAAAEDAEYEEEQRNMKKCLGLLHPSTKSSMAYDSWQMVCLLYLLIMLPWRIAFENQPGSGDVGFYLDILVDCSLGGDIFLNLRRFYFNKRTGLLITDSAKIRTKYLTSWFIIDALSIIPFDWVIMVIFPDSGKAEDARSARMLRLTRMVRFARLIKLSKLANLRKLGDVIFKFLANIGISRMGMEFFFTMGTLISVLLATMHVLSCLFLNMGNANAKAVEDGGIGGGWLLYTYGDDVAAFEASTSKDRYINAMYMMIVTMSSTGYGDLLPKTVNEKIYIIFVIFVGSFVYAYIIGTFSSTLANMSQDSNAYAAKMRGVTTLMQYLGVSQDLENRVIKFYEYKFSTKTLFDDHDIFDELPAKIRQDLILHRFQATIVKVPFFNGLRDDAVVEICGSLRTYSVMPGDHIVQRGDAHVELVILTRGMARSVPPHEEIEEHFHAPRTRGVQADDVMIEYPAGSFFGELEFLGFSEERSASFNAKRYCEIASLHPVAIEPVLKKHVKLRQRLQKYGQLKEELHDALDKQDLTEAELDAMKFNIEAHFAEEDDILKSTFDKYDANGDGTLDHSEILKFVVDMTNGELTQTDVEKHISVIDFNGSGDVTFPEFKEWWESNDAAFTTVHIAAEGMEGDFADRQSQQMEALIDGMSEQVNRELVAVRSQMGNMEQRLDGLADDFGKFLADMRQGVRE